MKNVTHGLKEPHHLFISSQAQSERIWKKMSYFIGIGCQTSLHLQDPPSLYHTPIVPGPGRSGVLTIFENSVLFNNDTEKSKITKTPKHKRLFC
jgi:hypothetical protein